jgi:hypothetical protein
MLTFAKNIFFFLSIFFIVSHASYSQELFLEPTDLPIRPVIAGLELTNDQYKDLATKILNVADTMTEEFKLSDSISLSLYSLKYFSEIGEYEVEGQDILKLVKGFLKLSRKSLPSEIWKLIHQVKRIKFGKKNGHHYVQIFSKKKVGIIYKVNEYLAAEDDKTGTYIKSLIIKNGAEIYFKDVETPDQYLALAEYVRQDSNALNIPMNWYQQLNTVNKEVKKNIVFYLNLDSLINPLSIKMKGIKISMKTNSIFKSLVFDIVKAHTLPGMTDGEVPLPSTIFKAKTKLLNLKLTVDQ